MSDMDHLLSKSSSFFQITKVQGTLEDWRNNVLRFQMSHSAGDSLESGADSSGQNMSRTQDKVPGEREAKPEQTVDHKTEQLLFFLRSQPDMVVALTPFLTWPVILKAYSFWQKNFRTSDSTLVDWLQDMASLIVKDKFSEYEKALVCCFSLRAIHIFKQKPLNATELTDFFCKFHPNLVSASFISNILSKNHHLLSMIPNDENEVEPSESIQLPKRHPEISPESSCKLVVKNIPNESDLVKETVDNKRTDVADTTGRALASPPCEKTSETAIQSESQQLGTVSGEGNFETHEPADPEESEKLALSTLSVISRADVTGRHTGSNSVPGTAQDKKESISVEETGTVRFSEGNDEVIGSNSNLTSVSAERGGNLLAKEKREGSNNICVVASKQTTVESISPNSGISTGSEATSGDKQDQTDSNRLLKNAENDIGSIEQASRKCQASVKGEEASQKVQDQSGSNRLLKAAESGTKTVKLISVANDLSTRDEVSSSESQTQVGSNCSFAAKSNTNTVQQTPVMTGCPAMAASSEATSSNSTIQFSTDQKRDGKKAAEVLKAPVKINIIAKAGGAVKPLPLPTSSSKRQAQHASSFEPKKCVKVTTPKVPARSASTVSQLMTNKVSHVDISQAFSALRKSDPEFVKQVVENDGCFLEFLNKHAQDVWPKTFSCDYYSALRVQLRTLVVHKLFLSGNRRVALCKLLEELNSEKGFVDQAFLMQSLNVSDSQIQVSGKDVILVVEPRPCPDFKVGQVGNLKDVYVLPQLQKFVSRNPTFDEIASEYVSLPDSIKQLIVKDNKSFFEVLQEVAKQQTGNSQASLSHVYRELSREVRECVERSERISVDRIAEEISLGRTGFVNRSDVEVSLTFFKTEIRYVLDETAQCRKISQSLVTPLPLQLKLFKFQRSINDIVTEVHDILTKKHLLAHERFSRLMGHLEAVSRTLAYDIISRHGSLCEFIVKTVPAGRDLPGIVRRAAKRQLGAATLPVRDLINAMCGCKVRLLSTRDLEKYLQHEDFVVAGCPEFGSLICVRRLKSGKSPLFFSEIEKVTVASLVAFVEEYCAISIGRMFDLIWKASGITNKQHSCLFGKFEGEDRHKVQIHRAYFQRFLLMFPTFFAMTADKHTVLIKRYFGNELCLEPGSVIKWQEWRPSCSERTNEKSNRDGTKSSLSLAKKSTEGDGDNANRCEIARTTKRHHDTSESHDSDTPESPRVDGKQHREQRKTESEDRSIRKTERNRCDKRVTSSDNSCRKRASPVANTPEVPKEKEPAKSVSKRACSMKNKALKKKSGSEEGDVIGKASKMKASNQKHRKYSSDDSEDSRNSKSPSPCKASSKKQRKRSLGSAREVSVVKAKRLKSTEHIERGAVALEASSVKDKLSKKPSTSCSVPSFNAASRRKIGKSNQSSCNFNDEKPHENRIDSPDKKIRGDSKDTQVKRKASYAASGSDKRRRRLSDSNEEESSCEGGSCEEECSSDSSRKVVSSCRAKKPTKNQQKVDPASSNKKKSRSSSGSADVVRMQLTEDASIRPVLAAHGPNDEKPQENKVDSGRKKRGDSKGDEVARKASYSASASDKRRRRLSDSNVKVSSCDEGSSDSPCKVVLPRRAKKPTKNQQKADPASSSKKKPRPSSASVDVVPIQLIKDVSVGRLLAAGCEIDFQDLLDSIVAGIMDAELKSKIQADRDLRCVFGKKVTDVLLEADKVELLHPDERGSYSRVKLCIENSSVATGCHALPVFRKMSRLTGVQNKRLSKYIGSVAALNRKPTSLSILFSLARLKFGGRKASPSTTDEVLNCQIISCLTSDAKFVLNPVDQTFCFSNKNKQNQPSNLLGDVRPEEVTQFIIKYLEVCYACRCTLLVLGRVL